MKILSFFEDELINWNDLDAWYSGNECIKSKINYANIC
jgi:hypothetical protein